MFLTLNADLEVQDLFEKPVFMVDIPNVKEKNVVGTHTRSRTGCLCCREAKKRCDEVHPICGKCQKRGIECIWPSKIFVKPRSRSKKKGKSNDIPRGKDHLETSIPILTSKSSSKLNPNVTPNKIQKSMVPKNSDLRVHTLKTVGKRKAIKGEPTTPDQLPFGLSAFLDVNTPTSPDSKLQNESTIEFDLPAGFNSESALSSLLFDPGSPFSLHLGHNTNQGFEFHKSPKDPLLPDGWQNYYPLPYSFLSGTFALYLDDQSLNYLKYFKQNVTSHLSITKKGSINHFVDTFFAAAQHDEAITRALAAWGAFFQNGDSETVEKLLGRSEELIQEAYLKKDLMNVHERFVVVCYYLVVIGIEVCRGDVKRWWECFKKCVELLQANGGIMKFCEENNYLNGVKWLILNIEFHDLLLSATQKEGTLIPMEDYRTLFTKYGVLDVGGYGLDAFQGACQPIIMILGEIMTCHVELKQKRLDMERRLREIDNPEGYEELRLERIRFYLYADQFEKKFCEKVIDCQPLEQQITLLNEDGEETQLEVHVMLFEVFRETCNMYILLYLKHHLPRLVAVQLTLLHCLSFIERLINTESVPALTMPLLVCGILCYQKCDRKRMEEIFDELMLNYIPRNLHRVRELLHEIWERNPEGIFSIDWADICEERGWTLSTC